MTGYREIAQLEGLGTILRADGSFFAERRYHLTVSRHMIEDGRGRTIPGMPRIDGHIVLQGMEGRSVMMDDGAEFSLRLQDGRSLPFFFCNSNGAIAARGPLA